MSVTLKGNGEKLAALIKKLSNAKSVEIGWNEEARYPGSHRNGGDFVANVAVINEYGGTYPLAVPARTQSIYRSIDEKSGTFKRGARFVKPAKANYETEADSPAHDVKIPARPFFRTMIAKDQGHYAGDLATLIESSDYNAKTALGKLGKNIQEELKKTIVGWTSPGNAASTKARKKRDDPLVETRQMRDTVNHWVK
jgi:hypothetical protein